MFRECRVLLTHGHSTPGTMAVAIPPRGAIVSLNEVIFPLAISLDRLTPSTVKAKIVVTVWRRNQERDNIWEHGYLSILQDQAPSQIFRKEQDSFKGGGRRCSFSVHETGIFLPLLDFRYQTLT